MARDKLTEYSATASENTVCGDVNIAENSALPSDMNNFAREVMSHLKNFSDGTDAITGLTVNGNIKLDGNYPVGTANVALGDQALDDGSLSGTYNTAIGHRSLTANTSGATNVSVGGDSMLANTTGSNNVSLGVGAMVANTTGGNNVAVGRQALDANTTASNNTAVGLDALGANTTGASNTAVGWSSLKDNTTGANNVAFGQSALQENTTASNNSAFGYRALYQNTTGGANTAVGFEALKVQTTSQNNVGIGYRAGVATTTGSYNCYIGLGAGSAGTTAFGNSYMGTDYSGGCGSAITTGSRNTIIGGYTGNQDGLDIRTLSNNIVLSDGDGNARAFYEQHNNQWYLRGGRDGFFATVIDHSTTGAAPNGLIVNYSGNNPDNHSGQFIRCQDTQSTRFRVYNDGDVQNHDNDYGGLSDQKLKEQIADASSQWDDIKALTVRKYKFKTDVADADTDSDALFQIGVIAQEVETAGMSGLVSDSPDIDADGNDLGTVTKGVKYSVLYMKAVKALQEAMIRIETLETKVAALEAE